MRSLAGAGEFAAQPVAGHGGTGLRPAGAGGGGRGAAAHVRLRRTGRAMRPQVLFPVTSHSLPDWLRSRGVVATAACAACRDPVIAICIDDLGEDLAGTDRAMALPKEVALSFLPYAETTPFLAQEAEGKGHDVLAHVPMEALSHTDPGADDAVGRRARHRRPRPPGISSVCPGLIGINNHEGSRFTEDAASLAPVVKLLAARHLFFFDSRTGPDTKVMAVAQAYGVASGERDVFLDDTVTEEAVRQQLGCAGRGGQAPGRGHRHRPSP